MKHLSKGKQAAIGLFSLLLLIPIIHGLQHPDNIFETETEFGIFSLTTLIIMVTTLFTATIFYIVENWE